MEKDLENAKKRSNDEPDTRIQAAFGKNKKSRSTVGYVEYSEKTFTQWNMEKSRE